MVTHSLFLILTNHPNQPEYCQCYFYFSFNTDLTLSQIKTIVATLWSGNIKHINKQNNNTFYWYKQLHLCRTFKKKKKRHVDIQSKITKLISEYLNMLFLPNSNFLFFLQSCLIYIKQRQGRGGGGQYFFFCINIYKRENAMNNKKKDNSPLVPDGKRWNEWHN